MSERPPLSIETTLRISRCVHGPLRPGDCPQCARAALRMMAEEMDAERAKQRQEGSDE